MAQFDSKTFNPEVFGKYVERIPNLVRNELIKSRALVRNDSLKALFAPQTGAFKGRLPYFGKIGKSTKNYDGQTDITANKSETYSQEYIVVGRADAWTEEDFSADITGGVDFMDNVAQQVGSYWDEVDTHTILTILEGVFSMNNTSGFVENHTYDLSGKTGADGNFGVTTLNSAMQKALGDNKSKFALAIMHSVVSTNLENLNLITNLKYTDKNGVQRDLALGTLNGRLVLVDDNSPVEEVAAEYELTSDVALDATKTYYTRSGSAGAYVYTEVATPEVDDIATYYEKTADGYLKYTTYVFGEGALEYSDVGAKVPYSMSRDEKTNGGETTLYSRTRKVFAPKGISFIGTPATNSPTDAELATGANWDVVNNGKLGGDKKYIDHRAIAICRIITKG